MKQLKAIAFAAIASFIATGGAFAQERAAQANVPFNFTVGEKSLPAGTYTVSSPSTGVLLIQNREKSAAALSLIVHDSNAVQGSGKLVFNRYADRYFLKEVLCPAASISASLPTSKQEKRTRMMEALLPGNSEILLAQK